MIIMIKQTQEGQNDQGHSLQLMFEQKQIGERPGSGIL